MLGLISKKIHIRWEAQNFSARESRKISFPLQIDSTAPDAAISIRLPIENKKPHSLTDDIVFADNGFGWFHLAVKVVSRLQTTVSCKKKKSSSSTVS